MNKNMKQLPKNGSRKMPKKLLASFGLIILVLAIFLALQVGGVINIFPSTGKSGDGGNSQTAGQNTKGVSTQNNNSSGTQSSSSPNSKNGSTEGATLVTPTGDFVSNHRPNLSGSPSPNTIESVCNATPGATCQITFVNTSTGDSKSLPAKQTDANGAAYWAWKLQDVGVTQGSWHIRAVAKMGNQTKTATDAEDMQVEP
jgi:cytoskeletal protein RodZ